MGAALSDASPEAVRWRFWIVQEFADLGSAGMAALLAALEHTLEDEVSSALSQSAFFYRAPSLSVKGQGVRQACLTLATKSTLLCQHSQFPRRER